LTVEYSSVQNKVNVFWTMGKKYKPTASDWLGIYRYGDGNKSYLQSLRTKGESEGALEIDFPSKPGMYQIKFFMNNSYDDVSASQPIHVGPHLELTSTLVNDKIRLSWRLLSGKLDGSDWIGFYRVDKKGNNYNSCHYPLQHPENFLEVRQVLSVKLFQTKLKFLCLFKIDAPRRGGYDYEFRFIPYACGYPIAKTERLFVPSKDKIHFEIINEGKQIKVTWETHSFDTSGWDWIGLYKAGARDNYYETYQYANQTNKFAIFDAPRTPGQYEFKYHSSKQAKTRHLSISEPYTVVGR